MESAANPPEMENYGSFHTQLVSIVEVLANAAVLEICKLVDDGFAHLRLEVSRTQRENLDLRTRLRLLEVGAPAVPPPGSRSEEVVGEGPSLAPKEELVVPLVSSEGFSSGGEERKEEEQAWSGSGLVGGPSTREGGDLELGRSTPAPGCGVASGAQSGDSLSDESKSSELGAPRRLSSRLLLLSPRPYGGAEDCPGSSVLSSSRKRDRLTSPSNGRGQAPPLPWVFSCPLCMKDFSTSRGLMVHQSIRHQPSGHQHTVRPFSCNLCGKRFLRSSSIKPHMAIHAGEQPYICTQCGRRFSARGNLVRHETLCTARCNASFPPGT
ncbi:unnamed protein product [Merluccius merluccius]